MHFAKWIARLTFELSWSWKSAFLSEDLLNLILRVDRKAVRRVLLLSSFLKLIYLSWTWTGVYWYLFRTILIFCSSYTWTEFIYSWTIIESLFNIMWCLQNKFVIWSSILKMKFFHWMYLQLCLKLKSIALQGFWKAILVWLIVLQLLIRFVAMTIWIIDFDIRSLYFYDTSGFVWWSLFILFIPALCSPAF